MGVAITDAIALGIRIRYFDLFIVIGLVGLNIIDVEQGFHNRFQN